MSFIVLNERQHSAVLTRQSTAWRNGAIIGQYEEQILKELSENVNAVVSSRQKRRHRRVMAI
jgi:hypothetical protein